MVGAPPFEATEEAPPAAPPSPPPAPAGKSSEEIKKEAEQAKTAERSAEKKAAGAGVAAIFGAPTEGMVAQEAMKAKQAAEQRKALEKELSEAKKREASARSAQAPAPTVPVAPVSGKKLFAQPAVILIIAVFMFLYLRFSGMKSLANWVLISALISIVIGIIFKEPKKGFLFLLVPVIIGFLNMMNMVTPANSIIVVGFVSMLILLTFEKTRDAVNKILNILVYVAGGILIFWLSAWTQIQLGTSYPQIVTTTLMIAYFGFVVFKKEKPALKFLAVFANIAFFFLLFIVPTVFAPPNSALYNSIESQRTAWIDMYEGLKSIGGEVYKGAQTQYYTAIGDYEYGVEAEQQKPLGVFLDNVGITSPTVKLTDSINAFGTLRVESFKTAEPVNVSVRCYVKDRENIEGNIEPIANFSVEQYESQDVDCIFPEASSVGIGPNVIDLEASFSFTTSSYLKSYFMEQTRIRDLRRQQKDPLDAFGITDKNPVAVFTGGPLMIGMSAGQQPVALLEKGQAGYGSGPTLSITFDKNWVEGELLEVKKLSIAVPPGLMIDDVDGREVDCPSNDKEEQVCVLEADILKRLFAKPIVLPKTIRLHTSIFNTQALLANAPLALRSFKVSIEYQYVIRKGVEVTVAGVTT